jgi:hypothetical protein
VIFLGARGGRPPPAPQHPVAVRDQLTPLRLELHEPIMAYAAAREFGLQYLCGVIDAAGADQAGLPRYAQI